MASSKELTPSTSPFFPNHFLKNQFFTKHQPTPEGTDLSGKVALVTGSNSGLGLECARQLLAHRLARLVLAVRSVDKGDRAAAQLKRAHPGAEISVWQLDMASYASVRALASRAEAELPRLDVAILNAGLGFGDFRLAPETGHEETVQVNYLSTALLAVLLLPALKAKSPDAPPGRLTISTAMLSIAARFPNRGRVPLLPSFDDPAAYDPADAYATSKLLGQMFAWRLADLVRADDVVVNLVEPGFVKGTALHAARPTGARLLVGALAAAAARTVQVGASTYLDASAVKGKESHGCILANWEVAP